MGNLKIRPVEITLGTKKYNVLFTISAIYDIQEAFKKPIFEVMTGLTIENEYLCKDVLIILQILIRESAKKEVKISELLDTVSAEDVLDLILALSHILKVSCSFDVEDDDIDYIEEIKTKTETPDICERMFTIGHEIGYKDDEIWNMAPRKLYCLLHDYNQMKTGDKPKQIIEDIM